MTEVHKLYYVAPNAFVPEGEVSSSARRGRKWFDLVNEGDMLNLCITESDESFGVAVVVAKELLPYRDVIDEAIHNHVASNPKWEGIPPEHALAVELQAAYGSDIDPREDFTVLHLIRITGAKASPASQFKDAYKAIESENRYQIAEFGEEGQDHTIDEWSMYIADYANEAMHEATRGCQKDALDSIRKVAAMGVVALQTFGSPHREGF